MTFQYGMTDDEIKKDMGMSDQDIKLSHDSAAKSEDKSDDLEAFFLDNDGTQNPYNITFSDDEDEPDVVPKTWTDVKNFPFPYGKYAKQPLVSMIACRAKRTELQNAIKWKKIYPEVREMLVIAIKHYNVIKEASQRRKAQKTKRKIVPTLVEVDSDAEYLRAGVKKILTAIGSESDTEEVPLKKRRRSKRSTKTRSSTLAHFPASPVRTLS
jgi:hypothetical protein